MNECCQNERHLQSGDHLPDTAPLGHYVKRGRVLRANPFHSAIRRIVHAPDPRRLAGLARPIARVLRARRIRRELLAFDEHMLHDIGLTYHDVERITGVNPRRRHNAPGADPLSCSATPTSTADNGRHHA